MATRKQKQELIDTLKFTPIKARILIQGYGGECYIGSVSREDYEFFKSKKIDVEQYVNDWDGELFRDVPDQHRFVEPGNAYDCDDLFHQSGATMDDSSRLTVISRRKSWVGSRRYLRDHVGNRQSRRSRH